jgi:5-methylcytosine-specific restriction endonuclease McrBC regulatory subunit McrC
MQMTKEKYEPKTSGYAICREGEFFDLDDFLGTQILATQEVHIRDKIEITNIKVKKELGLRTHPITIKKSRNQLTFKIMNITGSLILLGITIEIVPKFIPSGKSLSWSAIILEILARSKHKRYSYVKNKAQIAKNLKFVDHIALAYYETLHAALQQGKIRTYKSKIESMNSLQGRLLVTETINSLMQNPHKLVCESDYLDEDNVYNNLLCWALRKLQQLVLDHGIRNRLRWLEVESFSYLAEKALPLQLNLKPPSQYRVYDESIEIAQNLAIGIGHRTANGTSDSYGYVLNTEVMYERFVEESFRVAVAEIGKNYSFKPQDSKLFAKGLTPSTRSYFTRPDNVIFEEERALIVVDAKYKKFIDSESGTFDRPKNADIYQLSASLTSQECNIGILMFPGFEHDKTSWSGMNFKIWNVGVDTRSQFIIALSLDLSLLDSHRGLDQLDSKLKDLLTLLSSNDPMRNINTLTEKLTALWI